MAKRSPRTAGTNSHSKPEAARRWLDRVVAADAPSRERIWVGERGSMDADGRWVTFTATGTYEAKPLSYDWRARLKVMTLLWVLAKDGYRDDEGWGGAWIYGIKSAGKRSGPDVLAMQMIRNLAELVRVPDLARDEPSLEWKDAGKNAFEIGRDAAGRKVSVRFELDDLGDVVHASSTRPHDVPEGYADAPWRCDFAEPREFDGVRVPAAMTATYDFDDGPWEYFRSEVTSIDRQTVRD